MNPLKTGTLIVLLILLGFGSIVYLAESYERRTNAYHEYVG